VERARSAPELLSISLAQASIVRKKFADSQLEKD
jgi:hypothetical protein